MEIPEITKRTNIDLIVTDAIAQFGMDDTPALREVLGRSFDVGAMEAAVTPIAPGDPAAAEEECDLMATTIALLLKNPELGRTTAEQVLAEHHKRRAAQPRY